MKRANYVEVTAHSLLLVSKLDSRVEEANAAARRRAVMTVISSEVRAAERRSRKSKTNEGNRPQSKRPAESSSGSNARRRAKGANAEASHGTFFDCGELLWRQYFCESRTSKAADLL